MNLKLRLDTRELNDAIKKLKRFENEVVKRTDRLVKRLVSEGVEIAKAEVRRMQAIDFGDLLESIDGIFDPEIGVGIIYTDCAYAVFVEFGTGVVGSRHPHPLGGHYDVNSHGNQGWWYFDPKRGEWRWTKGQASRPFMYNTALELRHRLEKIKSEVLS